jgi:hypothetical protein
MANFTADDLAQLEKAIASGAKRVKYSDKEVEYNSLTDMCRARDMIRKELGLVDGRFGRILSSHSKGTVSGCGENH